MREMVDALNKLRNELVSGTCFTSENSRFSPVLCQSDKLDKIEKIIIQVYEAWNALDQGNRDRINNYKAEGGTYPLKDLLLFLFACAANTTEKLSLAEYERVGNMGMWPDTRAIGSRIDNIIKSHSDLSPLRN